ncbi:hypothetical protein Tco_0158252 [Tanacetum coccineum]
MSSFNQRGCFGCGGPLDGLLCRRCTCEWCGNNLRNGFCSFCVSRAGNSFVYDPNPNSFNDPSNVFTHPPQPQYETYSCELCGNDSHYGFDCPPGLPIVYEQEPCYNQNFGDNYYPQNLPSFPQQYLCCENCGGPHANFQCQPRNQNFYEPNLCYNSNSFGFDQPTQTSIDHQPPREMSVQELLLQEKLHKALQAIYEKLNQQEQAANVSTHTPEPSRRFNFIYDDDEDDDNDNDDEDSTIPLNEGDEYLSTIPKRNQPEVIKSSVEDFVPIPSESEETSDNDIMTSPILEDGRPGRKFKIYSNPLIEFNDETSLLTDNPLLKKVLEDTESEDSYVSKLDEPDFLVTPLSKLNEDECFDPGSDLVLEEIKACLTSDSIPLGIDDADFDPEEDILLLEKLLNDDPSSPLHPKELNFEDFNFLIKDTIPNLPPEVFLDRDLRILEDEPDKDDLESMVNVFNLGILISPTYVRLPFEDRHYFPLTFVIKIFLPFLTDLVNSLPFLSFGSEELIFDPDISTYSFYSLEPVAYGNPMMIFPFFCFCPKDKGIQGESS